MYLKGPLKGSDDFTSDLNISRLEYISKPLQRLNTVIKMQACRLCASGHTALKPDTTDFMT